MLRSHDNSYSPINKFKIIVYESGTSTITRYHKIYVVRIFYYLYERSLYQQYELSFTFYQCCVFIMVHEKIKFVVVLPYDADCVICAFFYFAF